MTKLIAIAAIVLFLFGGWHLFLYWEKVKNEEETQKKEAVALSQNPSSLPGLPSALEASLQAAQQRGVDGMRAWLKTYGPSLQDPRKGWIELDYCVMVYKTNPAEARKLFADVKERTGPASPIWPRVKELEKTFQ